MRIYKPGHGTMLSVHCDTVAVLQQARWGSAYTSLDPKISMPK